jgi:ribosomal protein S18 acetylase RimI-like enzyme
MGTRKLAPPDRAPIEALLRSDSTFTQEEVSVALEVVDSAIACPDKDYSGIVFDHEEQVAGYICYGRTPMTESTYDLYWVATHAAARGKGIATSLVREMEAELRERGARTVRIETSELESYGAARSFYERMGYAEVGRIADFYKIGDALVTFAKRIDVAASRAKPVRRRAAARRRAPLRAV